MSAVNFAIAVSLGTAILALFMALPMLVLARRRPANGWLALLVLALGALSFCDSGLWRGMLFGVFDWTLAALGPLYYCYVRSLAGLGNTSRQAAHFVPAVAAAAAFVWLRETLIALPSGVETPPIWDHTFSAVLYGAQASAVLYFIGVLWRLHEHRRRVRESFSATARRDLAWLAWLTVATLALLSLWLPATLLGGAWGGALGVGRVGLLFFIGWYGLQQAPVFVPARAPAPPALPATPPEVGEIAEAAAPPSTPRAAKYARSGMTDAATELIAKRLQNRMTVARDYLESDITLTQLAERVGTSPQLLSQYLNRVLCLNFFDYVNGLRVAEVQRSLQADASSGQSLLEVAFAAGFNSKSTFNAAFRKLTGSAPSAWRSAQGAASVRADPLRRPAASGSPH